MASIRAPNAAAPRGPPTTHAQLPCPAPRATAALGALLLVAEAELVELPTMTPPVRVPVLEAGPPAPSLPCDRLLKAAAAPVSARREREAAVSAALVGAEKACEEAGAVTGPYCVAVEAVFPAGRAVPERDESEAR